VRIPFPERIPLDRAALFATALFLIQIVEGTAVYFAVGCVAFILIATFAFNAAGGLTRASGAYVFFYSVLVVIVGICYKALLGEPAQSNLVDPRTDIEVYVGGITAMLAAVIVSRRISRNSGLLQNILKEPQMYRSSIGCIMVGVVGAFAIALLGESAGLLQSAFGQLNQFIPLGIIIGVMYEIRRSGGTRSTNLAVLLAGAYVFFLGTTGFSKQGMLTPLLCWLLPVSALRYRISAWQMVACFSFMFVVFQYLFPYSQYGRSLVPQDSTLAQRVAVAASLLEHPVETRGKYIESVQAETLAAPSSVGEYYNKPQGFWDRLQFVSTDDPLIDLTDRGNRVIGFGPILEAFVNTVPHFIWPNKPLGKYNGNYYAHELGGLADEDTTTGISFSPTAEAYHMAKWVGVLVVAPLLWFVLFVIFDSLFGDLRAAPWGLLAMVLISHTAPEGALSGVVHLFTFGVEVLVFCALFAAWVAPVIATAILGPGRRDVAAHFPLRPALAPHKTTDAGLN
jgi:hypothetical protein